MERYPLLLVGGIYAADNTTMPYDPIFALHPYDPAAQMYRAPYRMYDPDSARWTTRDPLGMVDGPNLYGYVGGMAVGRVDGFGLSKRRNEQFCRALETTMKNNADKLVRQIYNIIANPKNWPDDHPERIQHFYDMFTTATNLLLDMDKYRKKCMDDCSPPPPPGSPPIPCFPVDYVFDNQDILDWINDQLPYPHPMPTLCIPWFSPGTGGDIYDF